MTTLVRTDRVSGYKWVDFYVDQSCHWPETVTWGASGVSTGVPFGEGGFGLGPFGGPGGTGGAIDITGYTARFVVIRAGLDETPILDLISPSDITINGTAGTFSWDVPAGPMALLTHSVYQHELTIFPAGDATRATALLKGRVLVRAAALQVLVPPFVTGVGWGHGPYGHGPYGGS